MAKNVDPDQMLHSAVSDLGLAYLSQYLGNYGIAKCHLLRFLSSYTLCRFLAIFYRGNHLCYFLCALLGNKPLPKRVYSKKKEFAFKESKSNFMRIASPESVPILLNRPHFL